MPAVRTLVKQISIHRNTIEKAFARLHWEDMIVIPPEGDEVDIHFILKQQAISTMA